MFAGKNKTEKKEAATDANIVPGSARKQQRHPTPVKSGRVRGPQFRVSRTTALTSTPLSWNRRLDKRRTGKRKE